MLVSNQRPWIGLSLFVACLLGCAGEEKGNSSTSRSASPAANLSFSQTEAPAIASASAAGAAKSASQSAIETSTQSVQRKLVYTGDLRIEAKDLALLEKGLPDKVEELGGFVASYTESRRDLKERSGIWTVRVPVNQFSALLQWLDADFYVVEKSVKSQDVTEEFVDLQSRLVNKRKTEQRLTEHLAKSTSKLSEILEMEKEIERVREEIERVEGRLNLLRDKSELSTIIIRANTRVAFVAEKSPSTIRNLVTVFYNSWWGIGNILYGIIVLVVAISPFVIVLAAIAWGFYAATGQSPTRIFKRWRE